MRRFGVMSGALLCAVATLAACSSSGATHAATTTSAPARPPYAVRQTTFTFVDRSRPTPANGSYPGAPTRTLVTVVSMPVGAAGKLPLVVFSTGIGGTATNYEGLYRHWVEAGYIVAAPVFPLSNEHAPGGTTAADVGSQPGDVRFVLDQVLAQSAGTKGVLAGRVDPSKIALVGKSLGAITTLQVAFHTGDHETREAAVISLTGAGGAGLTYTGVHVPLLLVHGDADRTLSYKASVDAFAAADTPKFLVILFGQDHGGAFDGEAVPAAQVVEKTTLDFLDSYIRHDADALARLLHDGDVAGVSSIRSAPG